MPDRRELVALLHLLDRLPLPRSTPWRLDAESWALMAILELDARRRRAN